MKIGDAPSAVYHVLSLSLSLSFSLSSLSLSLSLPPLHKPSKTSPLGLIVRWSSFVSIWLPFFLSLTHAPFSSLTTVVTLSGSRSHVGEGGSTVVPRVCRAVIPIQESRIVCFAVHLITLGDTEWLTVSSTSWLRIKVRKEYCREYLAGLFLGKQSFSSKGEMEKGKGLAEARDCMQMETQGQTKERKRWDIDCRYEEALLIYRHPKTYKIEGGQITWPGIQIKCTHTCSVLSDLFIVRRCTVLKSRESHVFFALRIFPFSPLWEKFNIPPLPSLQTSLQVHQNHKSAWNWNCKGLSFSPLSREWRTIFLFPIFFFSWRLNGIFIFLGTRERKKDPFFPAITSVSQGRNTRAQLWWLSALKSSFLMQFLRNSFSSFRVF